jgi:hypothetical protein
MGFNGNVYLIAAGVPGAASVPEPSTYALVAIGLVAVVVVVRRRAKT